MLYEFGFKMVAKKIQHARSIQVIGIVKIFSIIRHKRKIIKGHLLFGQQSFDSLIKVPLLR